jgi:hypothetical protein
MISKIGNTTTNLWTDGAEHWGGVFRVEWITLYTSYILYFYLSF